MKTHLNYFPVKSTEHEKNQRLVVQFIASVYIVLLLAISLNFRNHFMHPSTINEGLGFHQSIFESIAILLFLVVVGLHLFQFMFTENFSVIDYKTPGPMSLSTYSQYNVEPMHPSGIHLSSSIPTRRSTRQFGLSGLKSDKILPDLTVEKIEHPHSESGSLKGLKVLLVDDNSINIFLAKRMMANWELNITTGSNGEEAIELLKNNDFDLILMDLEMPILNGDDATVMIRKLDNPKKAAIPIFAFTASVMPWDMDRIYKSGMNEYVCKPFDPQKMHELLIKYCKQRQE